MILGRNRQSFNHEKQSQSQSHMYIRNGARLLSLSVIIFRDDTWKQLVGWGLEMAKRNGLGRIEACY